MATMRPYLALLAAAAMVPTASASMDVSLGISTPNFVRSRVAGENYASPTRLLRGYTDDEERGPPPSLFLWQNTGKSVDDVFKLLKLNDGVENLLTNPELKTLFTYVSRLNDANPGRGEIAIKAITKSYGDAAVSKLLVAAKKVPETQVMANKLQAEQMRVWLADKQSPTAVFKLLKLDDAATNVLANPNLQALSSYVQLYNHVNLGKQATLVKPFTKFYGDDVAAKMFAAAKKDPYTQVMATRLQEEQKRVWLLNKQSPADVLKLLKLDDAASNALSNPNLQVWSAYLQLFNHVNPEKKTTMVKAFTTVYGDDVAAKLFDTWKKIPDTESLATKLQNQQLQLWLSKEKSPDDVFKLLKLDDAAETVLSSTNLNVWTMYQKMFNLKNPGKETTMLKTFQTVYGEQTLAKMLSEAKANPATKKIAESLEVAQFNMWMMQKLTPDRLSRRIFKLVADDEPYKSILKQYDDFHDAMMGKFKI